MFRRGAQIALTVLYPGRWLAPLSDETRAGVPAISVMAGSAGAEAIGERETDTALS